MTYNREFFQQYFKDGEFGLEQEGLRIDQEGRLAQTPHPFPDNPQIDRDFCENQTELITPVYSSIDELMVGLKRLKAETARTLLNLKTGPEYLWPFSSPPAVASEEEIPIAHYTGELASKESYRNYLAKKYGKWRMLYSGIHFNFSFPESLIQALYQNSGGTDSYRSFKNQLYLDLGRNLVNYSWLIVYLTAASPLLDSGFRGCSDTAKTHYASPRCSEIGYWNLFEPMIDFRSVDSYISSIDQYIRSGALTAGSELYYPVRLKPKGANTMENLRSSGINHIELRVLDLNPLFPEGINRMDLEFIHLLLICFALNREELKQTETSAYAVKNMKQAALYHSNSVRIRHEDGTVEALPMVSLRILEQMERFLCSMDDTAVYCIRYQKEKILNPSCRYAVILRENYQNNYVKKGLQLARANTERLLIH